MWKPEDFVTTPKEGYHKDCKPIRKNPRIFLAGSIEEDQATDWQKQIIDGMANNQFEIFNPRVKDWDNEIKQDISDPRFLHQVDWEIRHIELADIIVFYFEPGTKSPISLAEIGLCMGLKKEHVIVCCPEGFWRKGNVDIYCEMAGFHRVETLVQLMNKINYLVTWRLK